MYVVDLGNVSKSSIDLVGGKGANLGEMIGAGFPVPGGFCITSYAYDAYIQSNEFESIITEYKSKISERPEKAAPLASKLMDILKSGTIADDIAQSIQDSYKKMGDNVRVAVRSSATAEDLPEASFAGQQETYLNIIGTDDLLKTVKSCFSSLWTDRAISYRAEQGFDNIKVSLAIVVQQMIESDISGVLFTANPINNDTTEMTINASYGLGEAIVSGMVSPDTFIIDKKSGRVKTRILGSKEIAIVYDDYKNTVQKATEIHLQERYCISDEEIKRLADISRNIETHYNYPQDIEWAIKDGITYILQARSITTLSNNAPAENLRKKKQSRIDRFMMNNIIEHCPSPPYPLEVEPLVTVLSGRAVAMEEVGIKMNGNPLVLQNDGTIEFATPKVGISSRIVHIGLKIKQYMDFETNIDCTKSVFESSRKQLRQIETVSITDLSVNEVLATIRELMDITKKLVAVRFKNNIFPNVLINKLVVARLKRAKLKFNEYDLLSGLHYKTLDMNITLEHIVKHIRENKNLMERFSQFPIGSLDTQDFMEILHEFPEFKKLIDDFCAAYGWKSTNAYLAFSSTSWNEDISSLVVLLQSSLTVSHDNVNKGKYESIQQDIEATFSPKVASKLQTQITQIRSYHVNREESLYMAEWCYGLARMCLKEISRRFPDVFDDYSDILFLTLAQVYALENSYSAREYRSNISDRKKAKKKNQSLWDTMEVESSNTKGAVIKGVSGNKGKVKASVCIVNDISEFSKLKSGQVLVCKYTDPIWTPLFAIAKAVVSDTGGPLSHSAIVAREYGIPAVLGCGNATKILSDGDMVIVDGDNATVTYDHVIHSD